MHSNSNVVAIRGRGVVVIFGAAAVCKTGTVLEEQTAATFGDDFGSFRLSWWRASVVSCRA